jgi:heme exporter protein C
VWDARLTSELLLLFLYVGFMALQSAIDDPVRGDRAGAVIALVGVLNVPVIYISVQWWNTLHQGETVRLVGPSKLDSSMLWPLIAMAIGTKAWFVGSRLQRARAANLENESAKDWARAAVAETA